MHVFCVCVFFVLNPCCCFVTLQVSVAGAALALKMAARVRLFCSSSSWVGTLMIGCSWSTPQGVLEEACGGPFVSYGSLSFRPIRSGVSWAPFFPIVYLGYCTCIARIFLGTRILPHTLLLNYCLDFYEIYIYIYIYIYRPDRGTGCLNSFVFCCSLSLL